MIVKKKETKRKKTMNSNYKCKCNSKKCYSKSSNNNNNKRDRNNNSLELRKGAHPQRMWRVKILRINHLTWQLRWMIVKKLSLMRTKVRMRIMCLNKWPSPNSSNSLRVKLRLTKHLRVSKFLNQNKKLRMMTMMMKIKRSQVLIIQLNMLLCKLEVMLKNFLSIFRGINLKK